MHLLCFWQFFLTEIIKNYHLLWYSEFRCQIHTCLFRAYNKNTAIASRRNGSNPTWHLRHPRHNLKSLLTLFRVSHQRGFTNIIIDSLFLGIKNLNLNRLWHQIDRKLDIFYKHITKVQIGRYININKYNKKNFDQLNI